MQNISCEIKEKHMEKGEVTFVDFSLLGFKRTKDEKKLDFYYLFVNQTKEFIIVKESFLLDKNNIDDEMAYLNHPIHESIDMNKYTEFKKNSVKKIMERCNATNSYYCDFVSDDIINNEIAICKGIQFTLNGIQNITKFVIPISIYMKIQIIKNSLLFKLPIDITIDSNDTYNKFVFKDIKKVTYLGSEIFKDKGFVNYYSLREDNETTGIFLPIIGKSPKLIFEKEMSLKKFDSLYKKHFQIDLRNILILDWINNKQIICIYKKSNINEPVIYYLLDDNLAESLILNPYKCFE